MPPIGGLCRMSRIRSFS